MTFPPESDVLAGRRAGDDIEATGVQVPLPAASGSSGPWRASDPVSSWLGE